MRTNLLLCFIRDVATSWSDKCARTYGMVNNACGMLIHVYICLNPYVYWMYRFLYEHVFCAFIHSCACTFVCVHYVAQYVFRDNSRSASPEGPILAEFRPIWPLPGQFKSKLVKFGSGLADFGSNLVEV